MTRRTAMIAALALAALLAAAAAYVLIAGRGPRFADCGGGTVAGGQAQIGGEFSLIRQDGVRVTDKDVIDGPTLLYFGYTSCPDICPVDVGRNADAVDLLEERGIKVKPVMITVDPERDTPEVMADYVSYMHPRMVGLTGTPEEIEKAKQAYRVYGAKAGEADENGFYLVDHTTLTYLMAPGEGLLTFFRRDATPEDIAERTACYARQL